MPGLNQLMVVAIIIHVALFGSTIFLANAVSEMPYFGGDHGFLPTTGDNANAYDQFSGWLSGGAEEEERKDIGEGGIIDLFNWIIRGPACTVVSIVKFMISVTIIKYGIIDLLPNAGFGLWFKTLVHLVAALVHARFALVLFRAAIQAGIFSSPTMLLIVAGTSAAGFALTGLDALGVLSCG